MANDDVLDNLPANQVIELYYEKHHALRQGDMEKLLKLKKKCPEIFDKEKDAQIHDMIEYAEEFQKSDRYKELSRLEMKKKLSVITNDPANK